jgi:hypothetical protein
MELWLYELATKGLSFSAQSLGFTELSHDWLMLGQGLPFSNAPTCHGVLLRISCSQLSKLGTRSDFHLISKKGGYPEKFRLLSS